VQCVRVGHTLTRCECRQPSNHSEHSSYCSCKATLWESGCWPVHSGNTHPVVCKARAPVILLPTQSRPLHTCSCVSALQRPVSSAMPPDWWHARLLALLLRVSQASAVGLPGQCCGPGQRGSLGAGAARPAQSVAADRACRTKEAGTALSWCAEMAAGEGRASRQNPVRQLPTLSLSATTLLISSIVGFDRMCWASTLSGTHPCASAAASPMGSSHRALLASCVNCMLVMCSILLLWCAYCMFLVFAWKQPTPVSPSLPLVGHGAAGGTFPC
jgi:hypothetical protein